MLGFVSSQLRHRSHRAAALGAAILVAAVSFVLLSGAAKTSELRVQGSVESNYQTAYDVLVRPRGAATGLERREGLVRDNYLSGAFGGITLRQYERIKRLPGVAVAAPIANVGYILPFWFQPISLKPYFTNAPYQLYRVKLSWDAHDGGSRYPAGTYYVYYTRRDPFTYDVTRGIQEFVPGGGQPLDPWSSFHKQAPKPYGPFDPANLGGLNVFSALTPGQGSDNPVLSQGGSYPFGGVAATVAFPIFVSAIDPVEEAKLLHLDRTVTEGRYLRESDRPFVERQPEGFGRRFIPVLASTRSYLGETLQATIERLDAPPTTAIPRTLASPEAYSYLTQLPGSTVKQVQYPASSVFEPMLRRKGGVFSDGYWRVSSVRYRTTGNDRLAPQPTQNPTSVWKDKAYIGNGGFFPAPQQNRDVQFRRLQPHVGDNAFDGKNVYDTPSLRVVGRFDPAKLPSFSPLSRVPLETYYPPLLEPADAASTEALGGKPLLPTQNVGDYIAQPPLILTSLAGVKPFLNSKFFEGANAKAPISVIRVRVAGATGPDELSQARIRAVATAIHDKTGLDVDITAGSSPHPLLIDLPAGKFGRPALLLREGWSKKGVSVSFLNALDQKRLALFTLILFICVFFLANGAFANVRARRAEIGTLLCLGWSRPAIFTAVLGELALIGALAGLLGVGLAAVLDELLGLDVTLLRTLLVLPLAAGLAVLAGLPAAWRAGHTAPLDAVRPAATAARAHVRVRRLSTLGLLNLRRLPLRTALAAGGLLVGTAAFTILVAINSSFQGSLVGTVLGQAISIQIRGVDFVSVGLAIGLAAFSIGDLLFLNLRERAAEFVTLRTTGWRDRHLAAVVASEATALGLLGGGTGALIGAAVGGSLGVPAEKLALAAAVALAGAIAVALLCSIVPILYLSRLTPPSVLAGEA